MNLARKTKQRSGPSCDTDDERLENSFTDMTNAEYLEYVCTELLVINVFGVYSCFSFYSYLSKVLTKFLSVDLRD